ncbi:MAG: hypothetical protein WCA46_26455 [Actinocatenispora sp.]
MRVTGISTPRPGKPNEDLLISTGDLVVVLDGCGIADSLAATLDRGCRHGVPWYVRSLGDELVRRAADPAVPLTDALAGAIDTVTASHRDTCDLTNVDTPASTVCLLRQRGDLLDHLVLSDSSIVFDRRPEGGLDVVSDVRIDRALPSPDPLPLGSPERIERDRRSSAARAARVNRPDGFWVASTDPDAASHALTGASPVAGLAAVLVATDGGVRLHEFGELDWPALVDLVTVEGPEALVTRTREAETADATAVRWPRAKQYDDATLAYCTFP